MQVLEYNFSNQKVLYLVPLNDTHIGRLFDEEAFLGYRRWVLERDNAYTLLLGDIFECPVRQNKASDLWQMDLSPENAVAMGDEMFLPLREKVLAIALGNHSKRVFDATGTSPLHGLARTLGFTPGAARDGVLLKLRVGAIDYTVYGLHGWGGARRSGGQVNKVEEMAAVVRNADVYLQAHEHTLFVSRWDGVEVGGQRLKQYFVGCGCFQKYSPFQEGIARRMPNIGAPRIRFDGERPDVHVSI